jgi:LmbE family N-acetylglucosaminyl deacetylase
MRGPNIPIAERWTTARSSMLRRETRIGCLDGTGDSVPLRRPHVVLRGHTLCHIFSMRALVNVDCDDAALWTRMDGEATIASLRDSFPDVEVRLNRLAHLGVCEFALVCPPEKRRRVLVIETHMDDAVLSVGGLMWSLRETCEFLLVSIVGVSAFTGRHFCDRQFCDVGRVSELRAAESVLVARLLGGSHVSLGELDAPLRCQHGLLARDADGCDSAFAAAAIGHCASHAQVQAWSVRLEHTILEAKAQEVWLPLGVGGHADHELARNACLHALNRVSGLAGSTAIFLYQDVPYAVRYPAHTDQIVRAITAGGGVLERKNEDITHCLEDKCHLLSIYESQFPMLRMVAEVKTAARHVSPADKGFHELRYRVITLPGPLEPYTMYSARAVVQKLVERLGKWYRCHRAAPRLRVFAKVPSASWQEDLSVLLELFPSAILELHLGEEDAIEVAGLASPRIELQPFAAHTMSWVARVAHIAIARPCPLVLLMGPLESAAAQIGNAMCCRSETLLATSMNHFVLALRIVDGSIR